MVSERRVRDCVSGFSFDAAHYSLVEGELLLHGHTFVVEVCVEGFLRGSWVVDFIELRKIVEEIVKDLNYSFLVPAGDAASIRFEAPFKCKQKLLNCVMVTAECLGNYLCSELRKTYKEKDLRILVSVREGVDNKAIVEC
ncbi:MAG: 6-carboxytetrahydropterin synthase [Desulfurococcaceae archaeon TW002]